MENLPGEYIIVDGEIIPLTEDLKFEFNVAVVHASGKDRLIGMDRKQIMAHDEIYVWINPEDSLASLEIHDESEESPRYGVINSNGNIIVEPIPAMQVKNVTISFTTDGSTFGGFSKVRGMPIVPFTIYKGDEHYDEDDKNNDIFLYKKSHNN